MNRCMCQAEVDEHYRRFKYRHSIPLNYAHVGIQCTIRGLYAGHEVKYHDVKKNCGDKKICTNIIGLGHFERPYTIGGYMHAMDQK